MLQSWWQQYGKGTDMGVLFRFLQTFDHIVFNYHFSRKSLYTLYMGNKKQAFFIPTLVLSLWLPFQILIHITPCDDLNE